MVLNHDPPLPLLFFLSFPLGICFFFFFGVRRITLPLPLQVFRRHPEHSEGPPH